MTTATEPSSDLGVPTREGVVLVRDVSTRWFDTMEERPEAPPVVLIHGTGGTTRRHFPFLLPMLAPHQRVVSVDLATPAGAPELGPESMAEQVLAVLDEVLPGRSSTVVGYSLGAVVAAVVAARRPQAVHGLVLCAGWMRTDTQQILRNDVWHALRDQPDAHARYQVFCAYSGNYLRMRTPAELNQLLAAVRADDDVAAQMVINRAVDLTGVAPDITSPTLVVAGSDDQMTPPRQAKRLFGAIDDARYTEVTSGHAVIGERPAELVHLINTFSADPHRFPAGSILPARRP